MSLQSGNPLSERYCCCRRRFGLRFNLIAGIYNLERRDDA